MPEPVICRIHLPTTELDTYTRAEDEMHDQGDEPELTATSPLPVTDVEHRDDGLHATVTVPAELHQAVLGDLTAHLSVAVAPETERSGLTADLIRAKQAVPLPVGRIPLPEALGGLPADAPEAPRYRANRRDRRRFGKRRG